MWLELFTDDARQALRDMENAGVTRSDAVEPLAPGFRCGWISNPANTVHMVREPDAW